MDKVRVMTLWLFHITSLIWEICSIFFESVIIFYMDKTFLWSLFHEFNFFDSFLLLDELCILDLLFNLDFCMKIFKPF